MIHVLCARRDSVYRTFSECDVWDEDRDAYRFVGNGSIIAHPPCAQWSRLRHFSIPDERQKELARFCLGAVRKNGGVLEHPAGSSLWRCDGIAEIGKKDEFGGYVYPVWQSWFGHRARKATWLYIVGVSGKRLPTPPFSFGAPSGRVELMGKAEREATPRAFALWLINIAKECQRHG